MQNMSQTFCLRRTASSHHCLTHQLFPLTKAVVTLALMLQEILQELTRRQLPHGGWSYHLASRQASLEPTCLSLLALRSNESEAENRGLRFVISMQNPNGSWQAFEGDDREGSWTTSLALWALQGRAAHASLIDRGQRWLLQSKGRESHWLWKWKFRTTDRHVRFDPDKFGWPWMPETNSWVVPTSFSLLALRQHLPPDQGSYARFRIDRAIEMLLDRVCPGGGWNAGNGVVYGEPLAPHPDATAIALLALAGETLNSNVESSLDWLEKVAHTCTAPWSLAWASMALSAHQRVVTALLPSLLQSVDPCSIEDVATLAAVALALQPLSATNILGAQSWILIAGNSSLGPTRLRPAPQSRNAFFKLHITRIDVQLFRGWQFSMPRNIRKS